MSVLLWGFLLTNVCMLVSSSSMFSYRLRPSGVVSWRMLCCSPDFL